MPPGRVAGTGVHRPATVQPMELRERWFDDYTAGEVKGFFSRNATIDWD